MSRSRPFWDKLKQKIWSLLNAMNGGVCFASQARGAFGPVSLTRQMGGILAIARHRLTTAEPILLGQPIRIALRLQRGQLIQVARLIPMGPQSPGQRGVAAPIHRNRGQVFMELKIFPPINAAAPTVFAAS